MRQNIFYFICSIFLLATLCQIQTVSSSKFLQKLGKSLKSLNFIISCTTVQKNQKLFDGTCDLDENILHPKIKRIIDDIYKYDSEKTMDHLIRNQLLQNYTNYFENKYEKNNTFIDAVNSMKKKYDELGNKISLSTNNVLMSDFYDAFALSGMAKVSNIIIDDKDDFLYQFEDEETFQNYSKILNCPTGSGFCGKSQGIFKLEDLDQWSPLTLDQALRLAANYSLDFFRFTKPAIVLEYPNINKFLDTLKNEGTGKVKVGEFKKILNTTFIQTTIDYYNMNSEKVTSGRKTTTTPTTVTTTIRIKNNGRVAVEKPVLYGLPFAFLGVGIVSSVGYIIFKVIQKKKLDPAKKKPIVNEF